MHLQNVTSMQEGAATRESSPEPLEASQQQPRVCGLANLGNSCYFNSTVQCLAQTPFLVELLNAMPKTEENALPAALAATLQAIQSGGGTHVPSELHDEVYNKCRYLCNGLQHDAQELLHKILEYIGPDENKKKRENNEDDEKTERNADGRIEEMNGHAAVAVDDLSEKLAFADCIFQGELVSALTCQICKNCRTCHENFMDISVQLPNKPSPLKLTLSDGDALDIDKSKEHIAGPLSLVEWREKGFAGNPFSERERRISDDDWLISDDEAEPQQQSKPSHCSNDCEDIPSKLVDIPDDPNLELACDNAGVRAASPEISNIAPNSEHETSNVEIMDDVEHFPRSYGPMLQETTGTAAVDFVEQMDLEDENHERFCESLDCLEPETDVNDHITTAADAENSSDSHGSYGSNFSDWTHTLAPRRECENGTTISVQSCLNNFTQFELLTGRNKVECEQCKAPESSAGEGESPMAKTDARKQMLISNPPAILIVHLKRFEQTAHGYPKKLNMQVNFPLLLDVAPYCASRVRDLPNVARNQRKILYALYGIVDHVGCLGSGHYTAYVKVRQPLLPNDKRWNFIPQAARESLAANLLDMQAPKETNFSSASEGDNRDEGLASSSLGTSDAISDAGSSSSQRDDCTSGTGSLALGSPSKQSDDVSASISFAGENLAAPPGTWYYISDSFCQQSTEEAALRANAYLLFYERIY